LLLECRPPKGSEEEPCKWQVTGIKDKPSQPCQDSQECIKKRKEDPGHIYEFHTRQVQNVRRLVTCTHGKGKTPTCIMAASRTPPPPRCH
jgi:hypothetical protein